MNKYLEKIAKVYQEEDSSEFTHNGTIYNLNKVLRQSASSPVVQVPVKDLDWVLDYDIPNPDRVRSADLKAPILVTRSAGRLVAIDGLHRLKKAVDEGVTHLPGRFVKLKS